MSSGPSQPLPFRRPGQEQQQDQRQGPTFNNHDNNDLRDSPSSSSSSPSPIVVVDPRQVSRFNSHNAVQNTNLPNSFSSSPTFQFTANTIAPSPITENSIEPASLPSPVHKFGSSPGNHFTSSLSIQTELQPTPYRTPSVSRGLRNKASSSSLKVARTPSIKKVIGGAFGTPSGPGSSVPSPVLSALGDVTPLPSPLLVGDSPGPWKRYGGGGRPPSRDQMNAAPTPDSVLVSTAGESIAAALANASKRKHYAKLSIDGVEPNKIQAEGQAPPGPAAGAPVHGRNRSVSEYVPDPLAIPKRQSTVSGAHLKPIKVPNPNEPHLRREANLAESRGLTPTVAQPPTPPPSESSKDSTDTSAAIQKSSNDVEYFVAYGRGDGKKRRWRAVKLLGQGTFSRVMLATSQTNTDEDDQTGSSQDSIPTPTSERSQPHRKTLVAVKVCEHGPRGGASEERIEMSLKRELEIMQTIHHPSLVHLKAWNIEPTRAILVISHCIGGDLFDVATRHREVLKPSLLRRMFAELVGAVGYLHERRICHRDIKLENVLVNIDARELADPSIDWTTYPYSVITLTDLGLSRRIADDEKLETRCGSEDYAAPEVIMGLPYDGRATDAWSLGVLLYALLESRLPFDPYPDALAAAGGAAEQHRMRSRTSHRIARAEWRWIDYAGDDSKHDGSEAKFKEKGMLGALEITEGLLTRARSRWSLEKVAANPWVSGAICVEGGIQFREEEEGEEIA